MREEAPATPPQPERVQADPALGLTEQQVILRMQSGLANGEPEIKTKSIGRILRDNLITPFNILNVILGALVIAVGSPHNALFLGVMFCNILIGTFQEIRAKQIIDRLSLIAAPKAHVVRDSQVCEVNVPDLVLDDILVLSPGQQICADAVIVEGECEVNESLLTGEAEPVLKQLGDPLLSGSFLISGQCRARVEHVGKENYASKISASAKYIKRPHSEIMDSINKMIKWIGIALIPIGLALFAKQIWISSQPFPSAIVSTVAALVGMIPEGLVLLTSVVLAVSVIRLSRHKTLVQELYCIETLARVDTLCLDKTGTITEGTMQVDELLPLCADGQLPAPLEDILSALVAQSQDNNPTFAALKRAYEKPSSWVCTHSIPFSSARKWSGASFAGYGSFILGASSFILPEEAEETIRFQEESYAQTGQRILLLAYSSEEFQEKNLPEHRVPLAFLLLSDTIRPEAKDTLQFFAEQGVDLKVISGDNALTVANIAKRAGLPNADCYVDATTLETEDQLREAAEQYSVFGRVTPQQKLELIQALKQQGHTVAMTGDGVNDVLALKEADCSVAMASGSDAARAVSQLVLMDSNFSSMPLVVREGRRSINNLQRSASLFLVKALFSTIIAVCFIFIQRDYPFFPIQFTLINAFTIGIPSFLLALEPNNERIQGRFIFNLLTRAAPGAVCMATNVLWIMLASAFLPFSSSQLSTLCVMTTALTGLLVLLRVCLPFNWMRAALFIFLTVTFTIAILLGMYVLPYGLLFLTPVSLPMLWVFLPLVGWSILLMALLPWLMDRIFRHRLERVSFQRKK